MKFRQVIKMIEDDGWYHDRTKGSHRQFKHPTKLGVVTIAGKPNEDVPRGTLNNILKAGSSQELRGKLYGIRRYF